MTEDIHCDWKGKCKCKAHVEIFPYEMNGSDAEFGWGWSYLCFRHFIVAKVYAFFGLRKHFLWGKPNDEEE
jgi:hypothetical protein